MQYDLNNPLDLRRFQERSAALAKKGTVVELTEKVHRTLNQNNYLHLLIGIVALEVGEGVDYVKQYYFKRLVNPGIFVVTKHDPLAGEVETLRSSADLSKEEMTNALDRFIRWGREQGWVMPEPGDEELLRSVEIEMGRYQRYL